MRLMVKRGISFYIACPAGIVHRSALGNRPKCAYVPKKASLKLEDCRNWCSYILRYGARRAR
jgi:hypothetical protein